jgi:hypothetical protein
MKEDAPNYCLGKVCLTCSWLHLCSHLCLRYEFDTHTTCVCDSWTDEDIVKELE